MQSLNGRCEPVPEVGLKGVAREKLQDTDVVHIMEMEGLGLNYGNILRQGSHPPEASERFLHVVQHSKTEHGVKVPECGGIGRHEICQDGLDVRPEDRSRQS